MPQSELMRLIDQVSREKGIDRRILIETLQEAVKSAVRKKYGQRVEVEVIFNEEYGELEAFIFKEVVEEVQDSDREISVEEALQLDPESEIGDELGVRMDTDDLGRIAAQSAKQVIIQKIKDAERESAYEEYKDRKREIITGIVQRVDRQGIVVNLGRTEALLPPKEQIPREIYRQGDRIRAYILDVKRISKGPQIILSRTHPDFLVQLFRLEVPEIADGVVSIINAAREPGSRAKIAVVSRDPDVDPVGACVGMKGSRVQAVVQELRGERIDIVPWNVDPAKFVVNALSPAIITKVIIDQANKNMEVIVPDDQLSLAIGRRGQNVRLASRITGWHIDVKSESRYERQKQAGYQSLLAVSDMTEELADRLYESGIMSLEELTEASMEDLVAITELSESMLEAMQIEARRLMEKAAQEGDEEHREEKPEEGTSTEHEHSSETKGPTADTSGEMEKEFEQEDYDERNVSRVPAGSGNEPPAGEDADMSGGA